MCPPDPPVSLHRRAELVQRSPGDPLPAPHAIRLAVGVRGHGWVGHPLQGPEGDGVEGWQRPSTPAVTWWWLWTRSFVTTGATVVEPGMIRTGATGLLTHDHSDALLVVLLLDLDGGLGCGHCPMPIDVDGLVGSQGAEGGWV